MECEDQGGALIRALYLGCGDVGSNPSQYTCMYTLVFSPVQLTMLCIEQLYMYVIIDGSKS